MKTASDDLDIKTLAVCVAILYLKFFVVAFIQAKKSFDSGNRAPEDGMLPLAKGAPDQSFVAIEDRQQTDSIRQARVTEKRWRRMCQNDLESIPFAMGVYITAILAKSNARLSSCLMVVYTLARIAFSVSYAFELQPHRAVSYMIGVACIFASAITTLVAVAK